VSAGRAPQGILIPASNTPDRWIGGFSRIVPACLMAPFVPSRTRAPTKAPHSADLAALADLIAGGKLTPVIDRTYPLAQVPKALCHFGQGHTRGKIVITV
jgi:NADPH:quinone reductase-like Zn-dependent oxidoreductase